MKQETLDKVIKLLPWNKEPNKVEWEENIGNLECKFLIKRISHSGHLCGYIGIPFVGKEEEYQKLERMDFDVHGGITFSERGWDDDGFDSNYWYIGFDCAHCGDLIPASFERTGKTIGDATYKDIDFVKNELNKLANQLKKITILKVNK